MESVPVVAIVGRMNVGKSTLFNRLSTSVKSITLDYEGVTRDVVKDLVTWKGRSWMLVDTGGIVTGKQEGISEKVREKALETVEGADLVLFVVDGIQGVMNQDREIARILHTYHKRVILVKNKADSHELAAHEHEFLALGFKESLALSASHGTGIDQLLDMLLERLPQKGKPRQEAAYRVMLLGRPNVGKSSLMNALVKHERSIVADEPGTTRESVAERIAFYQQEIELIDTPGVRRKRAVEGKLESLMVHSSLQTIKDSDIVLMLIDASQGDLVDQELKLGFYAFADYYKALILLINKDDLATEFSKADLTRALDYYKHLVDKIPVMYISCKTGKNVGKIMPLIHKLWQRYSQIIPDEEINRLLVSSLQRKPLMHKGEYLRLYRAQQLGSAPLTIRLDVNEPSWFGPSQRAFFENIMRAEYDLTGVPVRFVVREHGSADS